MIHRISMLELRENFCIYARFDDGVQVVYDMRDDISSLPSFQDLETIPGLFLSGKLDKSRTCIEWNEYIDVPSHVLYEYGTRVSLSA
ncbi:MAG: DUF2442 domain-containing protein [Actinomycetaceae bacterium]|nr:DUF2442 domain-containing protein [Actinomycetaceae bacterium]